MSRPNPRPRPRLLSPLGREILSAVLILIIATGCALAFGGAAPC